MATIYRFIVENRTTGSSSGGNGRKQKTPMPKKTTAKTGRSVALFGGEKGGVEHNRKFRAINPLLNKATGGWWEKSTRLGRAGMGLIQVNSETGAFAGLSGVAIAIIISFIIQTILKMQAKDRRIAEELNAQNFKMLENGVGAVRGEYQISTNMWNGRQTFNQNK